MSRKFVNSHKYCNHWHNYLLFHRRTVMAAVSSLFALSSSVDNELFCIHCSNKLRSNSRFCDKCGKLVRNIRPLSKQQQQAILKQNALKLQQQLQSQSPESSLNSPPNSVAT